MPQAAPLIISAAVAAGQSAAVGFTIGALTVGQTALVIGGASLGLGLLSTSLSSKPKSPGFTPVSDNRTELIRQAAAPRRIIYGEARLSGAMFIAEGDNGDGFTRIAVLLATHEVQEIGAVYLNDDPIYPTDIDASGNIISGKYAGKVRIKKHLGGDDQIADPDLVAEVAEANNNFRARGNAYLFIRFKYDREIFPLGMPKPSAEVKGKKFFDPRSGVEEWSLNPILAARDYLTNTRYGYSEKVSRIDDSTVIASANICDEFVNSKNTPTDNISHNVTSIDIARDAISLDSEICKFQTGDRVEVSSDGTLPGGITASTSYYTIIEKRRKTDDVDVEIKLAASYDDALAGIAVDITSAGSGNIKIIKTGESRYTCSGVIIVERDPWDILTDLRTSFAGKIINTGGLWYIIAGSWQSPTISLGEDDLVSLPEMQTRHSRRERFNTVKGLYISPLNYDQTNEYPAVSSSIYTSEDSVEPILFDYDLPFTTRSQTAQRLARIELNKHRREIFLKIRTNLSGFLVQAGDTVQFSYPRFGFVDKSFEVVEWGFVVEEQEGSPIIIVEMGLRESDATVFDFDETTDEILVQPPPRSTLPNPFNTAPPSNLLLSSGTNELFVGSDGTVVSGIRASWDAPVDAFVGSYELQYKKSSTTKYNSIVLPSDATEHIIGAVEDGVAYDIRISATNTFGVPSSFIESLNHIVIGKTEPPPTPTLFKVTRLADGTRRFEFSLTPLADDVRVGGGFKIRFKLGTETSWNAMTDLHEGLLTVSPFETNELSAGDYTFACKAVDSSGNESINALFIQATLGNPRLRSSLYQQIEHPTWLGVKTNCFADGDGTLRATSTGTWDDLPASWDLLSGKWDTIVSQNTSITYETLEIDLGLELTFTPLASISVNGTPVIEVKVGSSTDGGVVGSWVDINTIGQVKDKQYVQYRVQVTDTVAPSIESMIIILDGEVNIEDFEDVNTAIENSPWFNRIAAGHFQVGSKEGAITSITRAGLTLQNVGAGWTWEIINKNSLVNGLPAAEFKVYNNSASLADAIIDVELKGVA